MKQDHPLVEQLMGELRMQGGEPHTLPKFAVENFVNAALKIERGDELYGLVRNVGALASAFGATKREALSLVLVTTLEPLLERLQMLAERDVANEQKRVTSAPKPVPVKGVGGALAPASNKGASARSTFRKGN